MALTTLNQYSALYIETYVRVSDLANMKHCVYFRLFNYDLLGVGVIIKISSQMDVAPWLGLGWVDGLDSQVGEV